MANLILIRGLPGSGKSTLATLLKHTIYPSIIVEADMYFVDPETYEYKFDGIKISEAHKWCQEVTKIHLSNDNNVIVSNTFTTKKELQPYFSMAKKYKCVPQVLLCQNNYGNIHNVPDHVIQKMKDRFEYDISQLFEG